MSASITTVPASTDGAYWVQPGLSRTIIVLAAFAGAAGGLIVGAHGAADAADPELTRLLRAMAVLKLAFVMAALAAMVWRLQVGIKPGWLAAYALVSLAMWAGPGSIWFASHLILASILLHAGIAGSIVLLWRDEVVGLLLRRAVEQRRSAKLG